ncbi:MAG: stage II sporulation protein M [Bacteroidota bacterium]
MKQATFTKRNKEKWDDYSKKLRNYSSTKADELAEVYVNISEDLAYSKSKYPKSDLVKHLNHLALSIHQLIYKNKKEEKGRFLNFWKREVPLAVYKSRKPLLYSLIIFLVSCIIGATSAHHDDTFVRLILGDQYVNLTLNNIERGDPLAIYKSAGSSEMFLGITVNNIRVSFAAFAMGLLFSFGTGYILFRNGVMLGSFQYFFYQKDLLQESFLTIWIHGTLEISAIVIAGGAGITLGNSFLFPGTLPRYYSFKKGARNAIKIIVGLIPIFIIAGFLEGFVTRHNEYPDLLRLTIILSSLVFVVYYFIYLPVKQGRSALK